MSDQLHASAAVPFLKGLTYPVLVQVWAKSMTIRDQNTLEHNYKNQGIGKFMEVISFVVTIKQTTFIQSDTTHIYFNQLLYAHTYATYFGLYVGNSQACHYKEHIQVFGLIRVRDSIFLRQ